MCDNHTCFTFVQNIPEFDSIISENKVQVYDCKRKNDCYSHSEKQL
jgi:hypothetical protein